MNITTILFDLDGTLLPMKQEEYAKAYIGGLVKSAIPYGYDPQKMKDAIIEGTVAMVKNIGEETNEKVFWNVLLKNFGSSILEPNDFKFFTTYENSHYCKPNLDYYRELLDKLHLDPKECLMVGNDVGEDMVVESLGMKVFLLTDCLINRENKDITAYPHGSFEELKKYIDVSV